jgi:hypothetical protein
MLSLHYQVFYYVTQSLISVTPFLCALKHAPELTPTGLKISSDDWKLFKKIKDNSKKVLQALKNLAGKKKPADDEE